MRTPYLESARSGLPYRKPMFGIRWREFIMLLGGASAARAGVAGEKDNATSKFSR